MKIFYTMLSLAIVAMAKPQQSPPVLPTSAAAPNAPPVSPTGTPPPLPTPPGPGPAHPPPSPSPAPPPPPATSPSQSPPAPPQATGTPAPIDGPICQCGYTYCAQVLMDMGKPWSEQQLSSAYCSTPKATCSGGTPATNVTSALFICLCDGVNQAVGNHLELLCGCDVCLNVGPDFRGRCQTPCSVGQCAGGGGGDGGGSSVGRGGSGGGDSGGLDSSHGGKRDSSSHGRRLWWS